MKPIIPNLLYNFTGLLLGRVYAIKDPDGITLIDTGLPFVGKRILKQLAQAGYAPDSVKRILITHAHPDHVGGLHTIQTETSAQVICHELEAPVIRGEVYIPRRESGLRPPKTKMKPIPVARALQDGDMITEVMGGLQAVHTPGHAPGHVAFWQPDSGVLFCGDVLFNLRKTTLPWKMLTIDMEENKKSVKKIASLAPKIICFGHGNPITHETSQHLNKFVATL